MSGSGGNSVFFVLWKSLTEQFEEAMIKVWKIFEMFIEENGEIKKQNWPIKQKRFQESIEG